MIQNVCCYYYTDMLNSIFLLIFSGSVLLFYVWTKCFDFILDGFSHYKEVCNPISSIHFTISTPMFLH
jgi:hypothetical protein